MKSDKVLLAILFGCLSSIPYELFTYLLVSLGVGKYSVYHLTSLIVTLSRPNFLIGAIVCLIVCGFIATVFYFSLQKLGEDYLIIKSTGVAAFCWVITETIYTWLIEGPKFVAQRPISDYYIQFAGTLIFGISLGILFKKYLVHHYKHFKSQ